MSKKGTNLERIRVWCSTGSGAAKVSSPGEDTPKAPRAFADPLAEASRMTLAITMRAFA
jgi:hypothetical protein